MTQRMPQKLLTIKELSEYLRIPVGSLYNMVYTRRIPVIRIGRLLRFDLDEVFDKVMKRFEKTGKN